MAAKKKMVKNAKKATQTKKLVKKAAPRKKAALKTKAAPKKVAAKKTATKAKPAVKAPTTNWEKHITPLDDRMIVAPEAQATMTAGGIIIPSSVNDRPVRGKVLATGRGRRNKKGQLRPLGVKVGDQVMYAEWSGTKIEVSGQEVLILREEDVLGIVT